MTQENQKSLVSGMIGIFAQIALVGLSAYFLVNNWDNADAPVMKWVIPAVCVVIALILFGGYVVISPNESAVLVFMGKYKGTLKENGFWFTNPFYGVTTVSMKMLTLQTDILEVNEKTGIPIEIAAIINLKVADTFKYHFGVEDIHAYIKNQAELCLRDLAKNHTYSELSNEEKDFMDDLTTKLELGGLQVVAAKISHLNYIEAIAASMLQKQQATSMSEARRTIVENAIGIAQEAGKELTELNASDKSKFISNLIIVLCGDRGVSPVLPLNQ